MKHVDQIQALARRIEEALERGIAQGHLSAERLLAPAYAMGIGERLVCGDSDDALRAHVGPLMADALDGARPADLRLIDRSGYVPLAREDAPGQRAGRLIREPVWLRACRSTTPYRIEVERSALSGVGRLTMHMSAPVFVSGQHWGCVAAAMPL